MANLQTLVPLVREHFHWSGWEMLIRQKGLTIDRPYGTRHPSFPAIVYPLDYGYVNGTVATDGKEVDAFVGSADGSGLVALLLTTDHRRGDQEAKLIYNSSPEEIYLANGFINFDRALTEGLLVMRRPMHTLWP